MPFCGECFHNKIGLGVNPGPMYATIYTLQIAERRVIWYNAFMKLNVVWWGRIMKIKDYAATLQEKMSEFDM